MRSFSRLAAALALAIGLAAAPSPAHAQGADGLTRLRDTLKREPKVADVVKMALDFYRVAPSELESVRSSARARGWMPVVSGFVGYNSGGSATASQQTITDPRTVATTGAENVLVFTGGLAWDLRELVFNPSEVQTYAVVPMQRDITLEIVRTYYLRRQLQIRLALKPPTDPLALATLELRVEEYTGILNGMTGGSFMRVANAATQAQAQTVVQVADARPAAPRPAAPVPAAAPAPQTQATAPQAPAPAPAQQQAQGPSATKTQ